MRNYFIPIFKNQQHFLKGLMYLYFLMMAFIFTGCKSTKIVSSSKLKLQKDFCILTSTIEDSRLPAIVQNIDSLFEYEFALKAFFSKQDILMANATGTLQLITNLAKLEKDSLNCRERLFLEYTIQIQRNKG